MTHSTIIEQMNTYGKKQIPFIFILDFALQQPLVFRLDTLDNNNILFDINGFTNVKRGKNSVFDKPIEFKKDPVPFADYKKAFDRVQWHLHQGNSFLVNLTQPTRIEMNLSLREVFRFSQARYKLYFDNQFVVFSPETFVTITENGEIASNPMKGTIDARMPDAENIIINDEKEKAEHNTIVDLIRNDINLVASRTQVEQFRYVEKIITHDKPLLQISSKITGQLAPDYAARIGDIMFALLPAGSISGAPKPKTVAIIQETEGYDRGYYTGILGYFDGKRLDSGVMIRFIERQNKDYIFKSGGGITVFSQAEQEYQEMIDKVYVPIVAMPLPQFPPNSPHQLN